MVIRISRGKFPPDRFEDIAARLRRSGDVLIPSIRQLPGVLDYYAAIDQTSATMVNVSVWDNLSHAQQMSTFGPMLALAQEFQAAGVEFERPIINYDSVWNFSTRGNAK